MAETQTAEVLEQDGPTTDQTAEELATAAADKAGDTAETQATANEADDEIEEKVGKRLGGWQRKIKRLEQEIEDLRSKGGNVQQVQTQPNEDKPPVKPVRPKQSEFSDWNQWETAVEKFEADRDKYYEDKLTFELRQADRNRAQQAERETVAGGWAEQVEAAKKEFPDFVEVAFSKDVPMTNAMTEAIITSEYGAKIAYELGQHPDEADRIAKLPPVAAVREIGKIESRIAAKTKAAETDDEPPAASSAPKPAVPVRKTSSNPTELRDDIPYKEWLRRREAQLRSK